MHGVEVEFTGADVNVVRSSTQTPLTWAKAEVVSMRWHGEFENMKLY